MCLSVYVSVASDRLSYKIAEPIEMSVSGVHAGVTNGGGLSKVVKVIVAFSVVLFVTVVVSVVVIVICVRKRLRTSAGTA